VGSEAQFRYFSTEEIVQLQDCGVRTLIADPQAAKRRRYKTSDEHRSAMGENGARVSTFGSDI
jgi:hypothetical protein